MAIGVRGAGVGPAGQRRVLDEGIPDRVTLNVNLQMDLIDLTVLVNVNSPSSGTVRDGELTQLSMTYSSGRPPTSAYPTLFRSGASTWKPSRLVSQVTRPFSSAAQTSTGRRTSGTAAGRR